MLARVPGAATRANRIGEFDVGKKETGKVGELKGESWKVGKVESWKVLWDYGKSAPSALKVRRRRS